MRRRESGIARRDEGLQRSTEPLRAPGAERALYQSG